MRLKHNKKRNTAFLFEILVREYVKGVVKNNNKNQKIAKDLLKEFFVSVRDHDF